MSDRVLSLQDAVQMLLGRQALRFETPAEPWALCSAQRPKRRPSHRTRCLRFAELLDGGLGRTLFRLRGFF